MPRLVLDGFVVAPASWRLPAALRAPTPGRASLGRWRRAAGVPRHVQVGHEDRLLVVDLDGASARADLAGHERVWEIWPPLGASVDRDGRRVEAVIALVDRPDAEDAAEAARAARAIRAAGRVAPPRARPAPADWRTFKGFGAREHQDDLLRDAIHPTIASALRAREIAAWFFQRYVDGPGRRHHLRVRVRATTPRARAAFAARLETALAPARAAGAVVTVEVGDYHPERARFGAALAAAHAIFQSDSELACALLDEEARGDDAPDRLTQIVRSLDALARGLGLDLEARRALARARRHAEERHAGLDVLAAPERDEARGRTDAEFRRRSRSLRALLGAPPTGPRRARSRRPRRAHGARRQAAHAHGARRARARTAAPRVRAPRGPGPRSRAPRLHVLGANPRGPPRERPRAAGRRRARAVSGDFRRDRPQAT